MKGLYRRMAYALPFSARGGRRCAGSTEQSRCPGPCTDRSGGFGWPIAGRDIEGAVGLPLRREPLWGPPARHSRRMTSPLSWFCYRWRIHRRTVKRDNTRDPSSGGFFRSVRVEDIPGNSTVLFEAGSKAKSRRKIADPLLLDAVPSSSTLFSWQVDEEVALSQPRFTRSYL